MTEQVALHIIIGLGAVALLSAAWLLTFYRARVASVGRAIKRQSAVPANPDCSAEEGVSVVVIACDDASALDRLLKQLFEQEYSGKMEVIVVNDGKSEDVKDVVTRIKHLEHRPNLYITFTPPGLRNVSHRKLALTLGIKAAHYPIIITLTEQSILASNRWLARMVEPFATEGIELVIGTALPAAACDCGWGRRYRSFTHAADVVVWLSAALRRKPYRAHRMNMAFRKQCFYDCGGFEGALNLRGGDDDIFVSKLAARRGNSTVVCASQAAVTFGKPDSRTEFHRERAARAYTEGRLRCRPALFFGFSSLAAWLLLLTACAGMALSLSGRQWIAAGGFGQLLLAVVITLSLTWRSVLKALKSRPALIMVYPMMLRRPVTNLLMRLRSRRHRAEYHTWSA